jgi:hypothetical protein
MSKGARIRRERAAKREQARVQAPGGMVNIQALNGPFGAAPRWKQPNSPEEAITQVAEYMKSLPKLIVCGQLGLDPLPEAERRELLSGYSLFDALETVSRLQSRWDVAFTTTQRPDIVEADFLADGDGEACRRARERVMQHRSFLVSPRATAQLQREIIESASSDESAATIGRNNLVHMLLSITTEQNLDSEFAGDVPTEAEVAKLEREIPKMNLEDMLKYIERLIPDEVASNLFNLPLKYEMLLSNTYDVWFTAWPSRSKITGLGATPAQAFKIATGVELLDVMKLGHRIIKRSSDNHQVRFTRDELIADGVSEAAVDYMFSNMTLSLDGYREALEKDRKAGDIAHQRFTLTQYPFLTVDEGTIVMVRHQWAMERFAGATLYFEAWFNLRGRSRGLADRFKNAMNDAFEAFVGGILHRIADKSPSMRIIDESEMQAAWQEQKGKTPSVCDWMLLGEKHCVVIDATNHAVKEDAAQGLATFAEYAADIDKIFVEGKFEQLLSTIELAQKYGGWGNDVVDADTDFAPLVVVPDTGVPNGILTQFDIIERGRKMFQHLQPHVYFPGVVPVSDIQLLEGMADLARSVPTLPGQDRNTMKLLAGWRYAASGQGEASLQMFLHRRGFPLPLSKHILSNSRRVIALLDRS